MPPKVWDKPGVQRKNRPIGTSTARRPEKNHFKPWEAPSPEEEFGITSWMQYQETHAKKKFDEDDELAQIKHFGLGKCPSIENPSLFERDSLHQRFGKTCQYKGAGSEQEQVVKEPVSEEIEEVIASNVEERPKSETVSHQSESPVKEPEEFVQVTGPKRLCKSAIPLQYAHSLASDEKADTTADDTVSLPAHGSNSNDVSRASSCNGVELPESKKKVKKLIGIAQKYMNRNDSANDESEEGNDEGSDLKIPNNDTDEPNNCHNIEEVLLSRERYLSETYDMDQIQHHNTFQWVRDPGGLSPGRIIKLSYSQRERTFYSVGGDRCDSYGRALCRQTSGGNFRGIMAASLSNLSPSSLNMRHYRDSSLHFLNYGAQGTQRWGYENNSRGHFLPSENNVIDSKQNNMVLKKVTIQDANAADDYVNSDKQAPTEVPTDSSDFKKSEPTLNREKSKVQIKRTSPQLTIDSTKLQRNGSIPSQQQSRHMSGKLPREYFYSDTSSSSRIPIGDLLPAVEKSIQQNQFQKGKRTARDSRENGHVLTEEERALLHKREENGSPIGPPAFLPLHTRSPLQRAKEIANKRLHGHVTQNPDGSETVRVSSPRYQPRSLQRRAGSAAGRVKGKQETPRSPRQDRTPRLLLTKSKNVQRAF